MSPRDVFLGKYSRGRDLRNLRCVVAVFETVRSAGHSSPELIKAVRQPEGDRHETVDERGCDPVVISCKQFGLR